MAITSITIENFKGIGDAVTIPIRPITLLFGKNSAGKSTVLQALRYLREICDGLKMEEKLQKIREKNKSEDPRLQEMYELRDMLKAAHFLYLRGSNFDYSKIPKSTQTHGLKNISNISDDDLSEFNSLRDETLKSIQEKFNSTDDWLAPEDDWLNEDADQVYGEYGEIDPDHFTELGDFHSLVHRQELDRKIRIRLEFDIKSEQEEFLNRILSPAMKPEGMTNPTAAWIEMVTGWDEKQQKIYLDSYKYALDGEEWICLTPINRPLQEEAEWNHEGRFILNIYSKNFGLSEWMKDLSWLLGTNNSEGKKFGLNESKLKKIKPFLEECALEELVTGIVKNLHNTVLGELKDIRHLGPVRDIPRRNYAPYSYDGVQWTTGLPAWDVLVGKPQLVKKINQYMKNLALGYSIRQSEDREQRMQLYDETHKIYLHPLDIGFGISQVIPVMVGALDDTSQIFAVEQPELHVHPAVQVALGDVFIDGIKNSNRTILIETHSEHLLLRIMRRMRETFEDRIEENRFSVSPDDIAVLFVEWHDSQTIIREMPVNERGELVKAWPGGFFEEDIEEVFA